VKSDGQRKADDAAPAKQLVAENDWLNGRHLPAAYLAMLPEPSPVEQDISERVQAILNDPRLVPLLRILEAHNNRPRCEPERRTPSKNRFLLAPHLRAVLVSVQERNEVRRRLSALDQPAAEVRKHLQEVAADCKTLATLIRKGPQPQVALAPQSQANAALEVLTTWEEWFEASGPERQVVPFATLLERGADWFRALAGRALRAEQNRRPAATAAYAIAADLRTCAAEFLPGVFRRMLGHQFHVHVATIAEVASGLATDEDFVKKVDRRRSKPNGSGDKISPEISETVPCADT